MSAPKLFLTLFGSILGLFLALLIVALSLGNKTSPALPTSRSSNTAPPVAPAPLPEHYTPTPSPTPLAIPTPAVPAAANVPDTYLDSGKDVVILTTTKKAYDELTNAQVVGDKQGIYELVRAPPGCG